MAWNSDLWNSIFLIIRKLVDWRGSNANQFLFLIQYAFSFYSVIDNAEKIKAGTLL